MVRPVATEDPTGGNRIWLDSFGIVQGLRFSTNVHGDLAASWQMQFDPRANHIALQPGRRVLIPSGAGYWQGELNNPHRGDVWEFTVNGSADLATHYTAVASTSGNAWNLDEVVDEAIARGLQWTRPSALPTTEGNQGSGSGSVADVLDAVCDAENYLWRVSRGGALTAISRPSTTVAYLLLASDTGGGRSVQGFVTDVHVIYKDAADYAVKTVTRSVSARPYGRRELPLDVTSRGPISTARANSIGDNYLAKRGPRLDFTQAFTVAPGQLLTPGGTPVDNSIVEANDGAVKLLLTDPDTAAGELTYQAPTINMGETDYDEDSGILTVTPLEVDRTGLAAVFG
jgi:hypothetical protein